MEIGSAKRSMGKTGSRILLLLCLTLALLAGAVYLSDRLTLRENQLGYPGACVLFLLSTVSCFAAGKERKGRQILLSGTLLGLATAVILLMIGFLWDSDRITASGILRVSAACLGGCLVGAWLGAKKRGKGRRIRRDGYRS